MSRQLDMFATCTSAPLIGMTTKLQQHGYYAKRRKHRGLIRRKSPRALLAGAFPMAPPPAVTSSKPIECQRSLFQPDD
jgi:hypothetical protein